MKDGTIGRARCARCGVLFVLAALLLGCSDADDSGGNPIDEVPIEQSIAAPGLAAPADVVFDDLGVAHIYAPDADSVIFAQGYVTASQRFFMMDALRRFSTGRLSELFGSLTIATDVQMRTVFTTRDGRRIQDALWERLQADAPELAVRLQQYVGGINAWIADLKAGRAGATLPPEYAFALLGVTAEEIAPWTPQDTLALGRLQAYNLSDSMAAEIERARRRELLDEDLAADVFRFAPASPATVLPAASDAAESAEHAAATARTSANAPPRVPAERLDRILRMLRELETWNPMGNRATGAGSNNWIIAPQLTESGHAIMANDPHLQLFNPPIWHMVQLDAPGDGPGSPTYVRAQGVIFPGLPGVILGHNDFGAWGGTVSNFDVTDVYVEQLTTPPDYPASPRTVLFRGEQVPVLRIEETINVHRGAPVTAIIEVVPHHGPMVPDPDLGDDVVGLAATGMSVRWTGHEITLDSRFLNGITAARNVAEFREALSFFATGGQNWVWADVNGDIAYFPMVYVPQRPAGALPWLPLAGTGEAEWLADERGNPIWLPEDRIPQATNPAEGFVATANNDQIGITLDNDPLDDGVYLGWGYDLGFRQERIQDLLSNRAGLRAPGARMTLADVARYQFDNHSKEAARLLPFLFAAAQARPELVTPAMQDALDRLRAWGEAKPGLEPGKVAYDMVSGVDPADTRGDVTPRPEPVSDEERIDAVAASIFVGFTTRLSRLTFADDFASTGVGVPGGADATKALLHLLEDVGQTSAARRIRTAGADGQSSLWDDRATPEAESRDQILLAALAQGLGFLGEKFAGAPTSEWFWGRIHPVRFQHFFGQGGLPTFDLFPFPAPGGRFTVNPASFNLNSDDFAFAGGPSMRHVVVLDPDGVRAINILPGGNNGNPGGRDNERYNRIDPSIDYGTHIPGWIGGQTFELRETRAEVAQHAVRRLRLTP